MYKKQVADYQRCTTHAVKKMYGENYIPYQNRWKEYEARKAELAKLNLDYEAYEAAVKMIAKELEV